MTTRNTRRRPRRRIRGRVRRRLQARLSRRRRALLRALAGSTRSQTSKRAASSFEPNATSVPAPLFDVEADRREEWAALTELWTAKLP